MTIYVLLRCWYEGDSNLVDDSFVAAGLERDKLVENCKVANPHAEIFMPGMEVPDDGCYGASPDRFRIIEYVI